MLGAGTFSLSVWVPDTVRAINGEKPLIIQEMLVLKAEVKILEAKKNQCEDLSAVKENYLEVLKWETKHKDTVINKLQKAYVEVIFPIKKIEERETKDIKKLKMIDLIDVRSKYIQVKKDHHKGKIGVKHERP